MSILGLHGQIYNGVQVDAVSYFLEEELGEDGAPSLEKIRKWVDYLIDRHGDNVFKEPPLEADEVAAWILDLMEEDEEYGEPIP